MKQGLSTLNDLNLAPFHSFTITYKVAVYAPAERALYVLCAVHLGLELLLHDDPVGGGEEIVEKDEGVTPRQNSCDQSWKVFIIIFLCTVFSTVLHLPPLRFHCVGGCWELTRTFATSALRQ